jgi:hypothetical protein
MQIFNNKAGRVVFDSQLCGFLQSHAVGIETIATHCIFSYNVEILHDH